MHSLARQLFDFHRDETTGEKIYFRLLELFFVIFTVRFCWTWGSYIQEIDTVLLPLGIANYLDVSFMFDHGVSLINAGAVTLLCGLGFFRVWRGAYLGALLLFHLQYAARYCLGEISHGSNLVGMGVAGLAVAALLFRDPAHRRRFVQGFLYFFIGLGYTSAAFCKLIGTGWYWADGHHLWMWIAERQVDVISSVGSFAPNVLQEFILGDARLATLVLAFGWLAELSAVLMWVRRLRRPVLLTIAGLHIGIAVSMNIFFGASTYLLFLLGLPWASVIDWGLGLPLSRTLRLDKLRSRSC